MIFSEPMANSFTWLNFLPLLATTNEAEYAPIVLTGVLLTLVVIYLASKIGGELSRMMDLPPVLGELVGGVVVGASALHLVVFPDSGVAASDSIIMTILQFINNLTPDALTSIFQTQSEVVSVLAELGVIILLFEIGLESDLKELQKVGYQATIVACVGVAVPFAAGTAGLIWLFHAPVIPAIFAGAALTATSIGITSKVLSEIGQLKSREGQIIVGAAVIDDILGIIVLAVVASLAKTGEVDIFNVIYLIVSATVFLIGSILLGKYFNQSFVTIANKLQTRGNLIIPAFIFAFFMAFLGNAIHLEAILGAFAAGLVLDETDKRKELDEQVKPIADILVPVFFVTVGAKVDLGVLNPLVPGNREGLIISTFLIVVAIIGKVVTGWSIFGQAGINRLAVGIGMIPRGEVGLVFAGIGAASGTLDKPLQAAIVIMVILTTFLAPPLLRLAFKQSPKEKESLEEANLIS
ncbi:sodium:proton antiporter [Nostoc linckia z18]|uniref:Sodium:proton antiporter n=2 Tax=Nostoc linckia TaxID=92942 RepID=A0A9Q5ZB35_NOSLI|nr:cation:proton antiporter [Nostoc linckia]PHK42145.1 sodium:proton antiporter [Nostoc linckia z15]PHK47303.1 sodium:proton antiporter [Nostoc linckia z16]PHJ58853.1 sodium:proton antiporter [Nostoc linckia z3]PHJ63116.1 sodium:proton antiporter [Nostoc linckia z1]PHJ75739.1 sodium:proton antiporter [Nostoc linckia z2]